MKAIPTYYGGVRFRSRLEARWAAFFDQLCIVWDYEPIDLDGYIPDFIVEKSLLVEVKPIVDWEQGDEAALAKIRASGWTGAAILVGATFPADGVGVSTDHTPALLTVCSCCLRDIGPRRVITADRRCYCGAPATYEIDPRLFWNRAGNSTQWRAPRRSHAIERHVPNPVLEIANERSVNAEAPGGFCDRCGYPTGIEAPGTITGEQLLHADRARCDYWLNGESPCP